jgi:Na+-driven multidrug efflux pump
MRRNASGKNEFCNGRKAVRDRKNASLMKAIKQFLWTIGAGGLLGAILFAWFSPGLIEWYFSPPADLALSCKPAVQWAIASYRKVIFTGGLIGAASFALLFFAFGRRRKAPANENVLN